MTKSATRIIEEKITQKVIELAIAAGFELRVNDGEETVTPRTQDKGVLFGAMFSTDEDYLLFYMPGVKKRVGWVMFVYGNDGTDVISDYSTSLDDLMIVVDNWINSEFGE